MTFIPTLFLLALMLLHVCTQRSIMHLVLRNNQDSQCSVLTIDASIIFTYLHLSDVYALSSHYLHLPDVYALSSHYLHLLDVYALSSHYLHFPDVYSQNSHDTARHALSGAGQHATNTGFNTSKGLPRTHDTTWNPLFSADTDSSAAGLPPLPPNRYAWSHPTAPKYFSPSSPIVTPTYAQPNYDCIEVSTHTSPLHAESTTYPDEYLMVSGSERNDSPATVRRTSPRQQYVNPHY